MPFVGKHIQNNLFISYLNRNFTLPEMLCNFCDPNHLLGQTQFCPILLRTLDRRYGCMISVGPKAYCGVPTNPIPFFVSIELDWQLRMHHAWQCLASKLITGPCAIVCHLIKDTLLKVWVADFVLTQSTPTHQSFIHFYKHWRLSTWGTKIASVSHPKQTLEWSCRHMIWGGLKLVLGWTIS